MPGRPPPSTPVGPRARRSVEWLPSQSTIDRPPPAAGQQAFHPKPTPYEEAPWPSKSAYRPSCAAHAGGASAVSVDGATIGEVLGKLVAEYPGMSDQVFQVDGSLHKFVNIYVDDDDVRYLQGLETPVPDGAEVSILPAVAGG